MGPLRTRHEVWQEYRNERYINREYSWLQFNARVLDEAANPANPILERLKFLSIFESNLDEFFMVRVSGLIEQDTNKVTELTPEELTPHQQLEMISATVRPLRKRAAHLWNDDLLPSLRKLGIIIREHRSLPASKQEQLGEYFMREVFHVCTPLVLSPAPTFPFISNRSLNLAVELRDPDGLELLARVKIPTILPRLIPCGRGKHEFLFLEDLIANNLDAFFPGVEILGSYRFKVIRDADIEIRELEAADLVSTVEQTLHLRRFGDPVAIEVESAMPESIRTTLRQNLLLDEQDLYEVHGLIGLDSLWELAKIDIPSLRFKPHHAYVQEGLTSSDQLFTAIAQGDLLVHHPFDSFNLVEAFVESAATDPDVLGIKMTMYRMGSESPIVESLLDAAAAGKQVAAMVELKARFDESNNLVWAKALERAGVHVSFGFPEMKVHCKMCLVVRREKGGIRTYAHVGTGNFNPITARLYTDIGLFTCDPEITQDIAELFNFLTGHSKQTGFRKLVVAPMNLREAILERIQRETDVHRKTKPGRIIFKLNSLVDPEVIDALYEASQVGVQIDLIVRGICCLRAGVPGLSDNITVRSIVGQFLEHSRVYYFDNGGNFEALIGSADLMRRNLDRRIETLVPVTDETQLRYIRETLLEAYLKDNTNSWLADGEGVYRRVSRGPNEKPFVAQEYLMKHSCLQMRLES